MTKRIFSVPFRDRRLHEYSFFHRCSKKGRCLVHCSRAAMKRRKKSLRDHK